MALATGGTAFAFAGASALVNLITKAITGDGRGNLSYITSLWNNLVKQTLCVNRDSIISTKLFEIRNMPSRVLRVL